MKSPISRRKIHTHVHSANIICKSLECKNLSFLFLKEHIKDIIIIQDVVKALEKEERALTENAHELQEKFKLLVHPAHEYVLNSRRNQSTSNMSGFIKQSMVFAKHFQTPAKLNLLGMTGGC